ncbi:Uncharacterised protein [Serratia fonticola]|uniref:Uncharacterized protein n=1 Tax=Serratia fonticola TaxID=47917 RepID=A0A4U9UT21_SERFO|nr:Uncharacterised protein [Serratia fonticola]
MDADGAIDLTTRTEQIAQRQMGFNGIAVLFQHVEKQIDRFILLVGKQEVNPSHVFTRQAVGFLLFILLSTSAPHVPTVRGSYRQQQKQQL